MDHSKSGHKCRNHTRLAYTFGVSVTGIDIHPLLDQGKHRKREREREEGKERCMGKSKQEKETGTAKPKEKEGGGEAGPL